MAFSIIFTLVLFIALLGARNVISFNLQRLINNRHLSLVAYSLIFLPGVIIHEMSHFLTAAVLGVPTGKISFFPEEISQEGNQRLGSVQIGKTGIVRSSLIGLAPLIFGSLTIIAIAYWQFPDLFQSLITHQGALSEILAQGKQIIAQPVNIFFIYIIFAISNTMFISPSDRKSLPALFILFALLSLVAIGIGIAPQIARFLYLPLLTSLNLLSAAFFLSLIIDVILLLPIIALRHALKMVK